MPHAENGIMGEPTVNGEKPSSAFISHITSYPVVSDTISMYKSNPYGQKSIDIADHGYATVAKPVLPYLAKPYSIVSPYVNKADSLADGGLNKVDQTFPIVKEDTAQIKDTVIDYALQPLRLIGNTKNYLFDTYGDEYKKCGGQSVITTGKATISTGLRITADVLSYLGSYLGPKKEQAKEKISSK
ncbi:MAG: hypothetical protein M1827_005304 [Pycnora praestabilis]|nr:MAG: hypothetical protein M1827_005304 [Pycnora praestabilis]